VPDGRDLAVAVDRCSGSVVWMVKRRALEPTALIRQRVQEGLDTSVAS
jgi:hypothetical protein